MHLTLWVVRVGQSKRKVLIVLITSNWYPGAKQWNCASQKTFPIHHIVKHLTQFFTFPFSIFLTSVLFYRADIDECSRGSHGCHHNCRNVPGSYFCSCRRGFRLSNDLKTCVGMERFHYSLIKKKKKRTPTVPTRLTKWNRYNQLAFDLNNQFKLFMRLWSGHLSRI